jgi:hypothetical protein
VEVEDYPSHGRPIVGEIKNGGMALFKEFAAGEAVRLSGLEYRRSDGGDFVRVIFYGRGRKVEVARLRKRADIIRIAAARLQIKRIAP